MYHCYFLINYIGPPKVFFSFPLAPSLKSLPITGLGSLPPGVIMPDGCVSCLFCVALCPVLLKDTDLQPQVKYSCVFQCISVSYLQNNIACCGLCAMSCVCISFILQDVESELNVRKAESVQKKMKCNGVEHTNEMAALYFAMSYECLKIECEFQVEIQMSVDLGSVASQRKIHIIFKMYSNKPSQIHTVASTDLSIQSDCTQRSNLVTSYPTPFFKLLPYIHHVLYRHFDRNEHHFQVSHPPLCSE